MRTATTESIGYLPLQDHGGPESDGGELYRNCLYGKRLLGRRARSGGIETGDLAFIDDPDAQGDIISGIYWPSKPDRRPYGSFRFGAFPAVVSKPAIDDKAVLRGLPMADARLAGDDRYVDLQLHTGERNYAKGVRGVVLDSGRWDRQEPLFLPAGGELVSDWASARAPALSSRVYNTDREGALDEYATVDSAWRVTGALRQRGSASVTGRSPWALAWNLTASPSGVGYGLMTGRHATGGYALGFRIPAAARQRQPPMVAAWASVERGGPIYLPGPKDQHRAGVTVDGLPIAPAHLGTGTIFAQDDYYDGPLRFEPRLYPPVRRAPYPVEAHIAWDPNFPHRYIGADGKLHTGRGTWRLHSYTRWKKPEDEPPDDPEPDPDPTPDPDEIREMEERFRRRRRERRRREKPVRKQKRGVAGIESHNEIIVPSIVMRPSVSWLGDGRYSTVLSESVSSLLDRTPVSIRLESFVRSDAIQGHASARSFRSQARNAGAGDAAGGIAVLPSSLGIEDVRLRREHGLRRVVHSGSLALCQTSLAICSQIDTDRGAPAAGLHVARDAATGFVRAQMLDDAGAADNNAPLKLDARVCFGQRVDVGVTTRSGDEAIGATDLVVLSGGGNTLTLPSASAGARLIIVRTTGGSATTVAAGGGDSIDGGGTASINAGAGSMIISDGSSSWYTICC